MEPDFPPSPGGARGGSVGAGCFTSSGAETGFTLSVGWTASSAAPSTAVVVVLRRERFETFDLRVPSVAVWGLSLFYSVREV